MPLLPAHCPYCGEPIELFADDSSGAQDAETQDYVEDCAVCCRPIRVLAQVDAEGDVLLRTLRDDDA